MLKVFLADIAPKNLSREILQDRMNELENLVDTFGGLVIVTKLQRKEQPDFKTYVGKGKLEEIIQEMISVGANLLIVGNVLKPSQIFEINEQLRVASEQAGLKEPIKARDRIDLILKIFEKHAQSTEARLQIELAAIKHMGPRIYGMGMELSRQGGSSGSGGGATRGIGETNTERMKRHLKERQIKIKDKLKEFEKMRELHRQSRIKKGLPIIGIVGYTNAGKSSLLNALTKKGVLAENKLFATLGTNVGKLFLFTDPEKGIGKEVLLNDTIGFIRDLPPKLIDAFSSTLEDSIESVFLLHIIDASDPFIQERIKVVDEILDDIGAKQHRVLVFNKIDLIDESRLKELKETYKNYDSVFISIIDEIGLEDLKDRIINLI
ncbi:MAG TPA: GTPase HflX [Candidatus Absconditabacterales bacterium]|nr:GTPase HflX [Candidatus Absconditabacterales bacterium]HOQ79341.1 GTPase HflX [Candidatus Absconditabacterales bacterium]HPK27919.1 GTPase HflX [Candidatus Absconditabacterales bacterium]